MHIFRIILFCQCETKALALSPVLFMTMTLRSSSKARCGKRVWQQYTYRYTAQSVGSISVYYAPQTQHSSIYSRPQNIITKQSRRWLPCFYSLQDHNSLTLSLALESASKCMHTEMDTMYIKCLHVHTNSGTRRYSINKTSI